MKRSSCLITLVILAFVFHLNAGPSALGVALIAAEPPALHVRQFLQKFCVDCHGQDDPTAGLDLQRGENGIEPEVWEKVVRRLRSRQMPPSDMPQPSDVESTQAARRLELWLDERAAESPYPGRAETFRRLTRYEYQNAIRDLLAIDIDATTLLPKDESSHGFDNVTAGELSPTLLNRYVSAAQKISALAVGAASRTPGGDTFRVRPDLTQEDHLPGLPLGTRGGVAIPYNVPQDGEYEIRIRLARDRNEQVEGLRGTHELEVLVDRERRGLFEIKPPGRGQKGHGQVDAHLHARLMMTAGPHEVAVTFPKQAASLVETMRQPYQARFNTHRHPRMSPAVYQVSITGPYESQGPGVTPSRQRIFVCEPETPDEEEACARRILAGLARRAWRRPIVDDDLHGAMEFFRNGRDTNGFEAGIEAALAAVLVNPKFLFRIEQEPSGLPAGSVYPISDLELASRLSFFVWSSIPDEELLEVAERGELRQPDVLARQVRRMLADERAQALVANFAGQWLYLRNLESAHPDMRMFPDFDDNLRQAMRRETELFVESIIREDRSVLELLQADYTFLNERLARHYGIPHILGSHFRRVTLPVDSHRGGLLRQASILDGHLVCDTDVTRHPRALDSEEPARHTSAAPSAECASP